MSIHTALVYHKNDLTGSVSFLHHQSVGKKARARFGCRYQNKRYIVPNLSIIRDVLIRWGSRISTGYDPENIKRLPRFAISIIKSKGVRSVSQKMRQLTHNIRLVFNYLRVTESSFACTLSDLNEFTVKKGHPLIARAQELCSCKVSSIVRGLFCSETLCGRINSPRNENMRYTSHPILKT
jgi:hypothetical protein